jgi:hypothetical protein
MFKGRVMKQVNAKSQEKYEDDDMEEDYEEEENSGENMMDF